MARWLLTLRGEASDRTSAEALARELERTTGLPVVRVQSQASAEIEAGERQALRRHRRQEE